MNKWTYSLFSINPTIKFRISEILIRNISRLKVRNFCFRTDFFISGSGASLIFFNF